MALLKKFTVPTTAMLAVVSLFASGTAGYAYTPSEISNEKGIFEIVAESTVSPGGVKSVETVTEDNFIQSGFNGDAVENKTEDSSVEEIYSIGREDGFQLIGQISEGYNEESTMRFSFPGKHLRKIDTGEILVSAEAYGDPEYVIDPAWAKDSTGREITTYFEVEGSDLVQVVNSFESDYTIYADPYVRCVRTWYGGMNLETVFTTEETRNIAFGASLCALIPHIAANIACGGASALANYALSGGNCLVIKEYLPQKYIPISGRC